MIDIWNSFARLNCTLLLFSTNVLVLNSITSISVTLQKQPQTALNSRIDPQMCLVKILTASCCKNDFHILFVFITWAFHYLVLIFRLPVQHFQCTGAELCWDVLIYLSDMWPSRPRTDSEFCSPFQSAAGQRNLTFTMHFPYVWKTDWKCELQKVQESV